MGACDGCGTPEDVRQDNHIHVELDFVPVTERLPVEEREYQVLVSGWAGSYCMFYDTECDDWSDSEDGGYNVTRWAEIPTIEERE